MLNWTDLEAACSGCRNCSLCETRHHVVFGEGLRTADLMFIGEGPGEQEDLTGRPFVGRAGQFLDEMLSIIDLDRSRYFIGNMVKCRPPQNRDPLNTEIEACIGYLRNQVALIRPKIIVCLGRIAAIRLIREDFKITREHGQWFEKAGVHMMAMYHPSALLRDPRKRPEAFEDLKKLQAKIWEVCPETYAGVVPLGRNAGRPPS
ncbi:uracil-DNA glycosylase [Intestinimonas timonensis]|uniref:uracil-DNA glycosylase n=1 Tax=Intestinimonas timonensis TaxID=1689270 RepID=UPI003A93959A